MIRGVNVARADRSADHLARRCADVVDSICDTIVLSFAGWSLFYFVSLATQASMLWAGWPWIVITVTFAAVRGLRLWTGKTSPISTNAPQPLRVPASLPLVVCSSMVLVVALLGTRLWGVWPVAAGVIIVLLIQFWPLRRPFSTMAPLTSGEGTPSDAEPGWRSHVFAAAISITFGILGSFLLRPDADDAYYVNRATWVATRGTAALNDTMFSPNTLPATGGGALPTPSIEAAQGVLAHAIGIQAATFCYLLAVPVLGALSGWTTWRLIRHWASRRWALAMTAAMLFLLASGASIIGNYSIGRIWQGKATAVAILLPLVWLYLSQFTRSLQRRYVVILGASGVAFVGLTTTSALVVPVLLGSALLASLILRSLTLALGAVAFSVAPLLNGLVQILGPEAISSGGSGPMIPPDGAFELALNRAVPMSLLGVLALAWTPQLIRSVVGVLIGCGALVTMVTLLPGVFDLVDALTGAGVVVWRLAIMMPTWVLVGLLATLPMPFVRDRSGLMKRAAALTAVLATLAIPLVAGTWLWDTPDARLAQPTWKVDQPALNDVRASQRLGVPAGLWLMPPDQMEILAISTAGPYAVVPRAFYLPTLDVSPMEQRDRLTLLKLVSGRGVPAADVRQALQRLEVSLSCVSAGDDRAQRTLRRATGSKLTTVGGMRCHRAEQ